MATFPAPIKSAMYFKEKLSAVWMEWFRAVDRAFPSGDIVDTTSVQTLTNKVMDANDNTFSNFEHGAEVDNPSSGVHGVTGSVVGTTDTQALSAKTLTSPVINTQVTGTAILDEDDMASDSALKVSTQQAIRAYITSGTVAMSNKTLTSPVLNTGVSGTAILDEDDMASNSNTKVATQQSVKAYIDSGTVTMTNKTLTSPVINTQVTGTAILDEDDMASDSALKVSTQQAIRAYIVSGTVAMSNKTLTSPVINTGVSGTALATTVGTPGSDTIVVSEQGIREAITASAGGAKLATGTYTGNGGATQAITGVGFRPKCVIAWRVTAGHFALIKTDQDGLLAKTLATGAYYLDDQLISLDADGFTAGDGTGSVGRIIMTANAIVYNYVAFG